MPTLSDLYDLRGNIEPVIASVLTTRCGVTFYPTQSGEKEGEAWGEVEFDPGQEMSKRAICNDGVLRPCAYDGSLVVRVRVNRGALNDADEQARLLALRKSIESKAALTMIPRQGIFSVENMPYHALVDCRQQGSPVTIESDDDQTASEMSFATICAIRKTAFDLVYPPFIMNNYANNTAKLAAVSITDGTYARITGEGNRIEQFIGGDASVETNWVVIRNTVQLSVNNANAPSGTTTAAFTLNGVSCPIGQVASVGWVDPTRIPFTAAGANQLWQIIGEAYGGSAGVEIITGDGGDNPSAFASLCLAAPPRGMIIASIFCGAV